jgi:hypothetical protein
VNPIIKRLLKAEVLIMALIAAAAIEIRWRAGDLAEGDFRQRLLAPLLLVGIPLMFGGLLPLAQRQLASVDPRMSGDHRRHVQGALVFWGFAMIAISGWMASRYADLPIFTGDRETLLRGLIVLSGVAMAVRANFFAKLAPPDPAPEGWTRQVLNAAWILTALGLALIVAAIALPLRMVLLVLLAAAPILIWITFKQRQR